jgi:hypothetical protein
MGKYWSSAVLAHQKFKNMLNNILWTTKILLIIQYSNVQ